MNANYCGSHENPPLRSQTTEHHWPIGSALKCTTIFALGLHLPQTAPGWWWTMNVVGRLRLVHLGRHVNILTASRTLITLLNLLRIALQSQVFPPHLLPSCPPSKRADLYHSLMVFLDCTASFPMFPHRYFLCVWSCLVIGSWRIWTSTSGSESGLRKPLWLW